MHQLIQLNPLQRATGPVGIYPVTRPRFAPDTMTAPEGYAYVPILPRPSYDSAAETLEDALSEEADQWVVRPLTEGELAERSAATIRKVWPTSADFLAAFSLSELAAISLSTDLTIAALRLLIVAWQAEVWNDDPRIQTGLGALVAAGIISQARREEIEAL